MYLKLPCLGEEEMSVNEFERLWERHMNAPDTDIELLKKCLVAATTVQQAVQVFNAGAGPVYVQEIPRLALRRMIKLTQGLEDAKLVYSFASIKDRKSKRGSFFYPAAEKLAKENLLNFETR